MASGDKGSLAFCNWFAYQFWRFVYVQQVVGQLVRSAIEFPHMQKETSFNLETHQGADREENWSFKSAPDSCRAIAMHS
jgi:hypothetical protein